jgi:hypothetical protein
LFDDDLDHENYISGAMHSVEGNMINFIWSKGGQSKLQTNQPMNEKTMIDGTTVAKILMHY